MTPSRKMSKHLNGTWDAGQWDKNLFWEGQILETIWQILV